jgi:hypothetical protein
MLIRVVPPNLLVPMLGENLVGTFLFANDLIRTPIMLVLIIGGKKHG